MAKIAKSKPVEPGLPFLTWSLTKLADFLVAEGVVDDISWFTHAADGHPGSGDPR